MKTRTLFTAGLLTLLATSVAPGETITLSYDIPAFDRWNYPFKATPGTRTAAGVFGAIGLEGVFDDRDGQFLIAFDLFDQLETGLGEDAYCITAATLRVATTDRKLNFIYDPTSDPFTAFLDPADPDFTPDIDPGSPAELFGVAYRNGFTDETYGEAGPFAPVEADPTAEGIRNAYPTDFVDGVEQDVANNVRDRFEPAPFAIGAADVMPGEIVPIETDFVFELDVASPDMQAYLRRSADTGRLRLMVTGFQNAVIMGGEFGEFYTMERLFSDGRHARLEMTVELVTPLVGDITGDGAVTTTDLTILLGQFGQSVKPSTGGDLTGDGEVTTTDLTLLLGNFGQTTGSCVTKEVPEGVGG